MVSMTNYVTKALHKFQHPTPWRAQYSPHQWTRPNYGATKQLATPLDTSPPILEELQRRIQQIVGKFLCYARAVDFTMLPDRNILVEQQSKPTKNTKTLITQFLDYAATNLSAIIQYKSIRMIIHIDSDASYLSETRARSHTGGKYYLSSLSADQSKDPATRKCTNPHGMQNPKTGGGVRGRSRSQDTV